MGDKKKGWKPFVTTGAPDKKGTASDSQTERPVQATDPATVPDQTADTRPELAPDAGDLPAASPIPEYTPPKEPSTASTAPVPVQTMPTRDEGTAAMANPLRERTVAVSPVEPPTDFSVQEMPSLHQGAYLYVNEILHDPRLQEGEFADNPKVQDALQRLEKVQSGLRRLPPYLMVTDHYAHVVKMVEDDLAAEGYTPSAQKPENFQDPGEPERPEPGEVTEVKSDMTYERNREMVTNLENFFTAYDVWEADKPERPTRPSRTEGVQDHSAQEAAYEAEKQAYRQAYREWNTRFKEDVESTIVGKSFQIKPGEVYEVTQILGSGGMGFAFEAKNEQTGEAVALKISKAFRYNDAYVKEFPRAQIREAMALHTMTKAYENDTEYARTHDEEMPPLFAAAYIGSKQILDPGERRDYTDRATPQDNPSAETYRTSEKHAHALLAKRYVMLAMEQIKGPNLRMMLGKIRREGGLGVDRATDYADQLLGAVSWMHLHDVYHKDLKPSNIVIDADSDRLRIIDFGLAVLPAQVERQAVRIKAMQRISRDGRAPIYASSESSALNMTPVYAPDEELENDYYLGQQYALDIQNMTPEAQFDEVQFHAARRDNYAVGRMLYDLVQEIPGDNQGVEDERSKKIRYIASKLMGQNATISRKWPEHEYLTLQKAKEILADNANAVENISDYEQVVERGRLLYELKQELVQRALSRLQRGE